MASRRSRASAFGALSDDQQQLVLSLVLPKVDMDKMVAKEGKTRHRYLQHPGGKREYLSYNRALIQSSRSLREATYRRAAQQLQQALDAHRAEFARWAEDVAQALAAGAARTPAFPWGTRRESLMMPPSWYETRFGMEGDDGARYSTHAKMAYNPFHGEWTALLERPGQPAVMVDPFGGTPMTETDRWGTPLERYRDAGVTVEGAGWRMRQQERRTGSMADWDAAVAELQRQAAKYSR